MLSKKSAFRLERRVWRSRDVRSGDLMPLKLLLSGPTFSQTVRATSSYRYDEITWGARFEPAFHVDPEGDLVLEIDKVGALAPTPQS